MSRQPMARVRGVWLVSRGFDLSVFGGSALAAFALLLWGRADGLLERALPTWTWVASIVFVDVAHVWATAFRVYLDPLELRRRAGLYVGVPLGCFVAGVLAYSLSALWFWRLLAYLAVFHFVRQQYGFVALYRARAGEHGRLDRWLDAAAIYSATLYPLVWWHAHLPREFEWFVAGDFLPGLPPAVVMLLRPLHLALGGAWVLRQGARAARGDAPSPGKLLIVVSTWLSWYVGIVVFDSDYAFTVTNVLVHGVPYLALVWVWGRARWAGAAHGVGRLFRPGLWPAYVGLLALVAFAEEWLWDLLVWHERAALFPGPELFPRQALTLLVPLLALPQATHYLLDAWIWRVRGGANPDLTRQLGL